MVWQLKMQEKEKAGVKNVRMENVAQNYRGWGGKHEKGKKVQHKIADVENAGKVMHV